MFTTAAGPDHDAGKALYENRLEERLKVLTQPKLLIIDEIDYIPIDQQRANLFFQAGVPSLRAGVDPGDEQPESGDVGRGVRRHGDRNG